MGEQMREQIEAWKADYDITAESNLLPNDSEISSIWESYKSEQVKWWDGVPFGKKSAHPMLLVAVFYRTENEPEIVQLTWRSWYINTIGENGQMTSWIIKPMEELGPRDLCVDPFNRNAVHEPYRSEPPQK